MTSCDREAIVLELVAAHGAGWQRDANPDLVVHAASCEVCRDLADVSAALRDDAAMLERQPALPGAGLVWWRANIRARLEAARTAERPLSLASGAAAAAIAGAAPAIAAGLWPLVPAWPGAAFALCAAVAVIVSPLVLIVAFGRIRN
jgi:hypothetical protein